MTSRDFCYWLQGFFELEGKPTRKGLTLAQTKKIRAHLHMVFEHEIDPSMGTPEHQEKLRAIHNGMTPEQLQELKDRLEKAEAKADNAVRTAHSVRRDPFGPRLMC